MGGGREQTNDHGSEEAARSRQQGETAGRRGHVQGYALVLVAAILWATMGLFYKSLAAYGLPLLTIVFFRATVACLILFAVLGIWRRQWLRLERRDLLFFLAFGLLGVAVFYVVYIHAIDLTGMGMAAVLMYTAPAWVIVFSAVFLKEPLSGIKAVALALAVAGCALVGQVYDLASVRLNWLGVLLGLGAGLTYGLYTIFCKVAQRRHTIWSTLAYALGVGALFLLPLQSQAALAQAVSTPQTLVLLLLLGLVPTLGGGVAFNAGLRRVTASSASIVATLEPVVAMLLGRLFLGERLEALQMVGAGLILAAVVVLQREGNGKGKNAPPP